MRDAFIAGLTAQARVDPSIFLVIGDLGYGVVEDFAKEFPDQFLNAGVAEQNMIGMAAGLASAGKKVFVYSIGNFPTLRCLEQIRNDVCYHDLRVTIVSIGAGFSYGTLGYTHQAIEDIAIMRVLPGMRVLSPSDPHEVNAALELILSTPSPSYLRLGKSGEKTLQDAQPTSITFPNILRNGTDALILSTGSITGVALAAAAELGDKGISTCVASVVQIKPISIDPNWLSSFRHVFTLEEHSLTGGLGSAVGEWLVANQLRVNFANIGLKDEIRHLIGSTDYLRDHTGIGLGDVTNFILERIPE